MGSDAPTPDPAEVVGVIAGRECQAVWRCAIGDATGALDVLKNRWVNSRRKHDREVGKALGEVLDLIWAARDPAPTNYEEASNSGTIMIARIRHQLQKDQPDV